MGIKLEGSKGGVANGSTLKHNPVGVDERTRFENVHTITLDNPSIASNNVALEIAELIARKAKNGENSVLGLATGSSPISGYNDSREFWQRSEFRNKETAQLYDLLGLAEYEAMEAFKRHYI